MKTMPCEVWPRIGLSPRRYIAVTHHRIDRVALPQLSQEPIERLVLDIFERKLVATFELDADREIVAAISPHPAGDARVPGTPGAGNELDQFAVAPYQEVRGHPKALQLAEIGVGLRIEAVGEQGDDFRSAELARRQADGMDDNQPHRLSRWPLVAIG